MATISIVVPVYQAQNTLESCINSILAQTFFDFELLLIDDGSTDGSAELCDKYTSIDDRVKVVHQNNMGVSATRNKGIALSSGKYIMFCDSDDYVDPHWCEYMHRAISCNPDSFVSCHCYRVPYDSNEIYPATDISIDAGVKTYYEVWREGLSSYTVTKIYERSILINNNIRFRSDISFAEDVDFNVNYFKRCCGGIVINNKLYYYRNNPDSLMHKRYDDFFPIYSFPFSVRLPLIQQAEMGSFCDFWFADFVGMFSFIFSRKDLSFIKKLQYNQKMLKSEAFGFILDNMSGKLENPIVIKILKSRNYYLYWLFEQAVKFKNRFNKTS